MRSQKPLGGELSRALVAEVAFPGWGSFGLLTNRWWFLRHMEIPCVWFNKSSSKRFSILWQYKYSKNNIYWHYGIQNKSAIFVREPCLNCIKHVSNQVPDVVRQRRGPRVGEVAMRTAAPSIRNQFGWFRKLRLLFFGFSTLVLPQVRLEPVMSTTGELALAKTLKIMKR